MITFITAWLGIIILGILIFILIGRTHYYISKENFVEVAISIVMTVPLVFCFMHFIDPVLRIKLPGTIRTECKERSTKTIEKEVKGIKYQERQWYCKEYYPSWIYIDGEWKELVEEKK